MKRIPRSPWIKEGLWVARATSSIGFILMCAILAPIFHTLITDRYIVPGEDTIEWQEGYSSYYRSTPHRELFYWQPWESQELPARARHGLTPRVNPVSDGWRYTGGDSSYYASVIGTNSSWESLPAETRAEYHKESHKKSFWWFYAMGEGWLFKYDMLFVASLLTMLGIGPVSYPRKRRRLLDENLRDYERAAVLRRVLEEKPDPFAAPGAAGGEDLGTWRPTAVEPLQSFDIRGNRGVTDPFHGGFVLWLADDGNQVLRLVCPGREALQTLFEKTVEGWFRANGEVLPRHSHVGRVLDAYKFGDGALDPNLVHTRLMLDMHLPLELRPTLRVKGQMIAEATAVATELVHAEGAHQVVAPAGFFEGLGGVLNELSGANLAPLPLEMLAQRPALRAQEGF